MRDKIVPAEPIHAGLQANLRWQKAAQNDDKKYTEITQMQGTKVPSIWVPRTVPCIYSCQYSF